MNSSSGEPAQIVPTPFVGMEFESFDIAESYYKDFSKQEGFRIRIRNTKTAARSTEIISRIYVCANEGFYSSKSAGTGDGGKGKRTFSTMRTGCKAIFTVSKDKKINKWVVRTFGNNHNHEMISPSKVSYVRRHKEIPAAAKVSVLTFEEERMPSGKVAADSNSCQQSSPDRHYRNQPRHVKRKNLEVGDAQAVLDYFKRKQAENSNFFYAIQCDEDDRLVNFFWVDAHSRMAYQYFGDAITFDTTYRMNKYSMPFAPFMGVNHHNQPVLFGCALLQDETEGTFVWLFETWIESMFGRHPTSIITDQDPAIRAAIARVFPNTCHRLCLWHIKKKFPDKLPHVYHNSVFKNALESCICNSFTVEEYEERWHSLVVEHKLEQNQWLQGLYEIRESWIPVYNRNTFFAGMNTTQMGESISSFFNSFVNSMTTLHEFVSKYSKVLDICYQKERREDFESIYNSRILTIGSRLEQHAADIYTRTIFLVFQEELVKSNHFTTEKLDKSGTSYVYKVKSCFDARDTFRVMLDLKSQTGQCECKLFEFMGILCRHMLKVFTLKNIIEIPSHYILKRWTKEVTRGNITDGSVPQSHDCHLDLETLRITHVCWCTTQLAYLAGRSEDIYKVVISDLNQTLKKVLILESQLLQKEHQTIGDNEDQTNMGSSLVDDKPDMMSDSIEVEHAIGSTNQSKLGYPRISHTKGSKKLKGKEQENHNVRMKGVLEIPLVRVTAKRQACEICGEHDHNKRSCKNKIDTASVIDSTSLGLNGESMDPQSSDDCEGAQGCIARGTEPSSQEHG